MSKETTKEAVIRHAKSAGVTFFSAVAVELYAGVQHASTWGDVSWGVLLSAVSFTAARGVLKVAIQNKAGVAQ